ncbi:MAG: hypothetical protein IH914_04430 [candidate division Zixibacteria bacterium]|nr:hypothetical protein [candidate division Zixibacteria bacterium]
MQKSPIGSTNHTVYNSKNVHGQYYVPRKIGEYQYEWHIFQDRHFPLMRNWIKDRQQLSLVCSDDGDHLTEEMVNNWIQNSQIAILATKTDNHQPVGFCTLTTNEITGLPKNTIELCHLIVNPVCHYFKVGHFLCNISKYRAGFFGFQTLVGRTAKSNRFGNTLAVRESFTPIKHTVQGMRDDFNWYSFSIREVALDWGKQVL